MRGAPGCQRLAARWATVRQIFRVFLVRDAQQVVACREQVCRRELGEADGALERIGLPRETCALDARVRRAGRVPRV